MPKHPTAQEVIDAYRPHIDRWIRYAYDAGYEKGYGRGNEELERLRSQCHREEGEEDDKYPDGWDDHTTFYGWCSQCHRPHSGRWAHIWTFCPWCGAKIDWTAEQPYPGRCGAGKKAHEQGSSS